jgi:hypothetical protein
MYTFVVDSLSQIKMFRIDNADGSVTMFTEQSPLMIDYLAWVAEGNTAEEWQPESEGM